MPVQLSVNVNAVALLRNRRDLPWPDLRHLARIALMAGAHGITVHPRPDERHVRYADVPMLAQLIAAEFAQAEFNVEGYPSADFMDLVMDVRPHQVTLVPDDPAQATSDHGWDFVAHGELLTQTAARLKAAGMRVSMFCDPDADEAQISAAARTLADRVELYTGPYGATHGDQAAARAALNALAATAGRARAHGLGINAGHDLTVDNLPALIAAIPDLAEVSIGHAMTAEALEHGMAGAVHRFLSAYTAD